MAVLRDRPYHQFNFLVDLGSGDTEGIEAGFSECSPIAFEVAVAEYRNGNDKENAVRKITGLQKTTDVTLLGQWTAPPRVARAVARAPQIGPYAFRDTE